MSYCRWSSDNFKSDIYCFADVKGGFTVCVAGLRIVSEIPPLDYDDLEGTYEAHSEALKNAKSEKIGLSRDGKMYSCLPKRECIELLESLKEEGYHLPDGVIEAIEGCED